MAGRSPFPIHKSINREGKRVGKDEEVLLSTEEKGGGLKPREGGILTQFGNLKKNSPCMLLPMAWLRLCKEPRCLRLWGARAAELHHGKGDTSMHPLNPPLKTMYQVKDSLVQAERTIQSQIFFLCYKI